MTRIAVSAEAIAALGARLGEVADDLAWHAAHVRGQADTMGADESEGALAKVLGDFEHQRLVLGRALAALGEQARAAGGLYTDVEDEVGGAFGGGGAWSSW